MKSSLFDLFCTVSVLSLCLCGPLHASHRDEDQVRSRWIAAARTLAPADLPGVERAAEAGDQNARMVLVHALSGDSSLAPEPAKALRYARLAAEEGNPFAQAVMMPLVNRYPDAGTAPEYAFQMSLESALQGNSSGMFNAGNACMYGIGTPRDLEMAFVMLEDARRLGHPEAVQRLCLLSQESMISGSELLRNRLLHNRQSAGYRCDGTAASPSGSPAPIPAHSTPPAFSPMPAVAATDVPAPTKALPATGMQVPSLPLPPVLGDSSILSRSELKLILASTRDLRGRNLSGMNLEGMDFSRANLAGVNLRRADLYRADFSGADLTGADLSGASLERVSFRGTIARDANFSGASLFFARFEGADVRGSRVRHSYAAGSRLAGADLAGADLSGSDFSGADFTGCDLGATVTRGTIAEGARNFNPR